MEGGGPRRDTSSTAVNEEGLTEEFTLSDPEGEVGRLSLRTQSSFPKGGTAMFASIRRCFAGTFVLAAVSAGLAAGSAAAAHERTTSTTDIIDTATAAGNLTTFVSLLEKSGLDKELARGGPYTVFAPTDDAFARAPQAMLDAFAKDPRLLRSALLYEIVPGLLDLSRARTVSSVPTLNGVRLGVSVVGDSVYVNNARIVAADRYATSAVIHTIDTVLMPLASPRSTKTRAAFCSVAGNTSLAGKPIRAGTFLNLLFGQPSWDYHYAGAVPANYVEGKGLTCAPPPAGYVRRGTAPDELNVVSGLYPYYVK
jgi:uncharacterized surface protein with fasciclin (FAS1) repeats